jgi:hypothetical protein
MSTPEGSSLASPPAVYSEMFGTNPGRNNCQKLVRTGDANDDNDEKLIKIIRFYHSSLNSITQITGSDRY